ncbi:DNA helicase-2/ATP-dependent DNA helicase PcrA [Ereboglobus sp. PH5-10]|uniref:ATP-dependent helicase n=1 Tax=Ereboglobus sp. PH5-10 TaxID=2940629 RepID=UPI0024071F38|nr:ATP-dependent helicase [Ereboglobus sp. PH5-10]MDF9828471.1 DNA helicase-2/ATP-dependent DNA helicase PcrA [Ereboglobus sp. PH5-10]
MDSPFDSEETDTPFSPPPQPAQPVRLSTSTFSAIPQSAVPAIDFRASLNDEQYAAVTAEPGPLLVLAGAGSGKTRTLTYRVAYLLSKGVRPGEILLLTFTNKAAKEMLHRVNDLTGVEPSRFWGGTFHSIGHRALRMFGEDIGLPKNFTILDADEAESLLKQTVDAESKGFFKDKTNPKPGPLFNVISLSRNTQLPIGDTIEKYFPQYKDIAYLIPPFAAAYEKKKREQNVCDYDDLLEYWLRLLQKSPSVTQYFSERFRHILVDEYQDTNTVQAQIVDCIATHHRVMAVGDDAQCIYSWRGADFENIATFMDRHPGTAIHRIETNYRSTPEILNFANRILDAQPHRRAELAKELRAARGHGMRPQVVQTMDDREQADFVIRRIRCLVDEDGVSPSEIAVLYRSHFVAMEMQLALSRAGMPYHITSGVKFFERQHIKDIVAFVRFVYNPADELAWQRIACLLPKVGEKSAQKIHAVAREHAALMRQDLIAVLETDDVKTKVPKGALDDWPSFCASLSEVAETMRAAPPAKAFDMAVNGWYGDYLRGAFADYIDRLEELKALVGFASRYETMQDLLAQIVLLNGETSDRQVDPDAEAIKLTTVHQAKGLEYDVVFVIGVADGYFPGRRAIEDGDVEEERRLFYVASTRAKNELYLCYPKVATRAGPGGMLLEPSRFLKEIDTGLYDILKPPRRSYW